MDAVCSICVSSNLKQSQNETRQCLLVFLCVCGETTGLNCLLPVYSPSLGFRHCFEILNIMIIMHLYRFIIIMMLQH